MPEAGQRRDVQPAGKVLIDAKGMVEVFSIGILHQSLIPLDGVEYLWPVNLVGTRNPFTSDVAGEHRRIGRAHRRQDPASIWFEMIKTKDTMEALSHPRAMSLFDVALHPDGIDMPREDRKNGLEIVRSETDIIVNECQKIACTERAPVVAGAWQAVPAPLNVPYRDGRVRSSTDLPGVRLARGGVINDDDLARPHGLSQQSGEALLKRERPTICHDDNRDAQCTHAGGRSVKSQSMRVP